MGAGASVPYGYPTGAQLRLEICGNPLRKLGKRISFLEIDDEEKFKVIEHAESLAEKFEKSSTGSIDLFLARNHEFSQTGKLAIILALLSSNGDGLFSKSL